MIGRSDEWWCLIAQERQEAARDDDKKDDAAQLGERLHKSNNRFHDTPPDPENKSMTVRLCPMTSPSWRVSPFA